MRLQRLQVQRFRGIHQLDWWPSGQMVCLVGPGDSTKTTILAAIEWALSPRWQLTPTDSDFFRLDTSEPIVITATVTDLSDELKRRFGMCFSAWDGDELIEPRVHEPPALTIRLEVASTMEPAWTVLRASGDGVTPSASDRASFGMTRLGEDVDRHLAWGRDSALMRMTSKGNDASQVLAEAHRAAKAAVDGAALTELATASDEAHGASVRLGAGRPGPFAPGLLDSGLRGGTSALGLHEGVVAARALGLGTRRLIALAIQVESFASAGIALVDEVESGLEPHRLVHLLGSLRSGQAEGQVIMTTHATVPLVELACTEIAVVRVDAAGDVIVKPVPAGLQDLVRRSPEALLARKVIVTEGKTELGLCRAMRRAWARERGGMSIAHKGVVLVDGGGGAKGAQAAMDLLGLSFPSSLLVDSDVVTTPSAADAGAAGVHVVTWADTMATENRVSADLPLGALKDVVALAEELHPGATGHVAAALGQPPGTAPDDWLASGVTEADIRIATGTQARINRNSWFKRTDSGERLGEIVAAALPSIATTDLAVKLGDLRDWAYAD